MATTLQTDVTTLQEDVEANDEDIGTNQSGIDSNRDGVTRHRGEPAWHGSKLKIYQVHSERNQRLRRPWNPRVLPPLSVGEMTLRLYGALNYSQNSAHDLRRALNGA